MKKPDILLKPHTNPIFDGMPEVLKDHKNYAKIQKALLETLATPHSHSDVLAWSSCLKCQGKITSHRIMVQKLGFKSPAQYFAWKKTHEEISKRVRYAKYND